VGGTKVPAVFNVIKSATYNEAFTAGAKTDAFELPVDGKTLKVEVNGVPVGRSCGYDLKTGRYVIR
jgi:hypothetical protein